MQNVELDLVPGEFRQLTVSGARMLVQTSGVGEAIDFEFSRGGAIAARVSGLGQGAKVIPNGGFDSIKVSSSMAGRVTLIIMDGDVDILLAQKGVEIVNGPNNPVQVDVKNWPITTETPGKSNSHAGPYVIGTRYPLAIYDGRPMTGKQVKVVRIRNAGKGMIAVGGPLVTIANAAILLAPGDIREDTDSLKSTLSVISDIDGGIVTMEVVYTS